MRKTSLPAICFYFVMLVFLLGASCYISPLLPCLAQQGETQDTDSSHVQAVLLADCKAVVPGKKFRLGVELKMEPGWHTYYRESGDAGMPTRISFELPAGFQASQLTWEMPHKMIDAGITTYGYSNTTLIAADIQVPADFKQNKLAIKAKVSWLACKDACLPGSTRVLLTLPVLTPGEAVEPDNQDKFNKVNFNGPISQIKEAGGGSESEPKKQDGAGILKENFKVDGSKPAQAGIFVYLAFAYIGGFILNLMPCVLPVISIKVFSLIKQAGEDPKQIFQHGMTFALGIILSFISLAGLVIALQGAGQKIGWGFQFQYPVFVLCLAAIVTLFALSMFGVFYFDLSTGQKQMNELADREGLAGTFFKGVLATVLSTPCTAPFLGTALGFAFVQPWWVVISIFLVIALGMSTPYFVLALRPQWMKYLPRPGLWMEKFKESMGFLLLATVVWLFSVLSGLVDPDAVIAAISFMLCLSLSSWIQGRFIDLNSSGQRKITVSLLSLSIVAAGYWFYLQPFPELLGTRATLGLESKHISPDGIQWQDFSLSTLDKELQANKTVFIDFTARWCLTCKVNESTIINTTPVIAKFKELNVLPLKADWTAQDAEISDIMRKFGRSGVPLYVIFPAGQKDRPIVLPEALTQQIVLEALDRAGASH